MKTTRLITVLLFCTTLVFGQNSSHKYSVTNGAFIQQYNGNLGNSFFKFNTTCFAGGSLTFGAYLNKYFDINIGGSISDFGYAQTAADANRVVSLSQRCPGCKDRLGMGELRSRMTSGDIAFKYKIANGMLLKEDSKISPYISIGVGMNRLTDNMKRNCVNVGNHFTVNGGVGVKYNFNERFNVAYDLAVGCFVTKKVYYTNALADASVDKDADDLKMEKRKDLYMQNGLTFGFNF